MPKVRGLYEKYATANKVEKERKQMPKVRGLYEKYATANKVETPMYGTLYKMLGGKRPVVCSLGCRWYIQGVHRFQRICEDASLTEEERKQKILGEFTKRLMNLGHVYSVRVDVEKTDVMKYLCMRKDGSIEIKGCIQTGDSKVTERDVKIAMMYIMHLLEARRDHVYHRYTPENYTELAKSFEVDLGAYVVEVKRLA